MDDGTMNTYPMTRIICPECEFEMIIIFIEHADEIGTPLYCPHCATKTEEKEIE